MYVFRITPAPDIVPRPIWFKQLFLWLLKPQNQYYMQLVLFFFFENDWKSFCKANIFYDRICIKHPIHFFFFWFSKIWLIWLKLVYLNGNNAAEGENNVLKVLMNWTELWRIHLHKIFESLWNQLKLLLGWVLCGSILTQTAPPKVPATLSSGKFSKDTKIGHFLRFFKGGTKGKSPKK